VAAEPDGLNARPDPGSAGSAVGVIGVGLMGLPMAQRLRDAGHRVRVCDIDAERRRAAADDGLRVVEGAAAIAATCAVAVVAVVDGPQVMQVVEALCAAAPGPLRHVLLCPTIGPDEVCAAAERLAEAGMAALDVPMSGGPARARDGSMSLMVAGDPHAVAACQPVLDALSSQQVPVGERLGDGARTKLVNNLLAAANLAAAAEALALAERVGLDPARTLDLIDRSSGQSWIAHDRMTRRLAGDTAPRAHLRLLTKDSALALQMARQAGFEAPVGAQAAATFRQASDAGLQAEDDSALLDWHRRR
jgi:3-hydroxyisobutyrate dehydrogenase-like beta-hydroxyacid dehydrogenase